MTFMKLEKKNHKEEWINIESISAFREYADDLVEIIVNQGNHSVTYYADESIESFKKHLHEAMWSTE